MRKITHQDKSIPISRKEILAASLLTVPVYCSVLTPIDMVKNRLQIQSYSLEKSYSGPFDCFSKVFRTEGFRGIYQGFLTTCAMRFVGVPFYFLSYETTKNYLKKENETNVSSIVSLS
jgi:solute carrier family 25 (mitochondrial carnitine/acylcarnitine transporter), member 20/29